MPNTKSLIAYISTARKLHADALAREIAEDKRVIQEKKFVIQALQAKKLTPSRKKKAITLVKEWKRTHHIWKKLSARDKALAQIGGPVSWHKKWISYYEKVLQHLQSI